MGIRRVLAGAVLGLAGSALLALPAAAVVPDPYGPPSGVGGDNLGTSTTQVGDGGTVTVSGTGFAPNSTITISVTVTAQGFGRIAADAGVEPMGSLLSAGETRTAPSGWAALACVNGCTVTANAAGAFSVGVTLTQVGTNVIAASGVDPAGNPRVLTTTVIVTAAGGVGGDGSGSGSGSGGDASGVGGLPDTGADLKLPIALGSVLLLLGGGAALLGRRRKRTGAAV